MSNQKTRAAVPPPKKSFLPETRPVQAADNMKDERLAPMTFNMPRNWHKEFKSAALMNDMNMKELLLECFEAWKRERK